MLSTAARGIAAIPWDYPWYVDVMWFVVLVAPLVAVALGVAGVVAWRLGRVSGRAAAVGAGLVLLAVIDMVRTDPVALYPYLG